MKLFITGGSGDLGRVLCQRAAAAGHEVTAVYLGHPERITAGQALRLDLCDAAAVKVALEQIKPEVIVHTAVVQNLPDPREQIVSAARNVGEQRRPECWLIALSSDMVFDGTQAPYREDAPPAPLSLYGAAKAQAEAWGDCIVRTSLIYDLAPGNRQMDWLLDQVNKGQRIRLFYDEYRSPVWVVNLADALLELAERRIGGILNVAGSQRMSRLDLGRGLLEAQGINPDAHIVSVSQAGTGRPPDLTLDVSKGQSLLHTPLLSLREARERGR